MMTPSAQKSMAGPVELWREASGDRNPWVPTHNPSGHRKVRGSNLLAAAKSVCNGEMGK
jgi:hypothetical protein